MDLRRCQELFFSRLSRVAFADPLQIQAMTQISFAMDGCPLQDSYSFRGRYLGRSAAHYLMDEKGDLDMGRAARLRKGLAAAPFPLGPRMEGDASIYAHLISCLGLLEEREDLRGWIRKFSLPLCHGGAGEIIRETLWPSRVERLGTAEVRRAALTAWLTPLRQATGSCFATAPAILIQSNQPEGFFKDLYDLLSMGQMRRTFAGKGHTVPLSATPGWGDLQRSIAPFSHVEAAPGLRVALEAAGFGVGRVGKVREKNRSIDTVDELLRAVVLDGMGLTEGEILEEAHLARLQMSPLMARQGGVYYQKLSERGAKAAEFEKRLKKARHVFRSLTECALLRSWEYSMASLCDVKVEFARWNLYVGLGLHPEKKGGVGDFLYQMIDAKLRAANDAVLRHSGEYESALSSVRAAEGLLHRSMGEGDRHRVKVEMASAMQAANVALEMRDKAAALAEALSHSFSELIRQYDEKLQEQFQEIFDPSLEKGGAALYEDSPAGFRLVFKHGRSDASLWTLIHSEDGYVDALREFFSSVEREIRLAPPLGPDFVAEVTTGVIQYVGGKHFLEAAIARARSEGRLSPWHYVSGGTMQNLVQNYYGRDQRVTEVACVPRSADDLMRFIQKVAEGKTAPLLIHSPTHAFILRPDRIGQSGSLAPAVAMVKKWDLSEEAQEHLAHKLSERLEPLEKPLFLHLFRKWPAARATAQFRAYLIEALQALPSAKLQGVEGRVDSFLYENFPLLNGAEAAAGLQALLKPALGDVRIEIEPPFMGSWELLQRAKEELLASPSQGAFSSIDWDLMLAERARALHLVYPVSSLFADTNWSKWLFGWVVNPATGELQLWRLNRTATQGVPMHEWSRFFSPQNTLPWIALARSEEYSLP